MPYSTCRCVRSKLFAVHWVCCERWMISPVLALTSTELVSMVSAKSQCSLLVCRCSSIRTQSSWPCVFLLLCGFLLLLPSAFRHFPCAFFLLSGAFLLLSFCFPMPFSFCFPMLRTYPFRLPALSFYVLSKAFLLLSGIFLIVFIASCCW